MKIELKNVKFYESMSEETNCFQADIYIDGKKAGYAKNDGGGGNTHIDHYDGYKNVVDKADAYLKTLPEIKSIPNGYISTTSSFTMDSNLENMVDHLFFQWLLAKDAKKASAKLLKDFSKGICYGTPDNYAFSFWKGHTIESLLKIPAGVEVIKKAIAKLKAEGKTILNTNLPSELMK